MHRFEVEMKVDGEGGMSNPDRCQNIASNFDWREGVLASILRKQLTHSLLVLVVIDT